MYMFKASSHVGLSVVCMRRSRSRSTIHAFGPQANLSRSTKPRPIRAMIGTAACATARLSEAIGKCGDA